MRFAVLLLVAVSGPPALGQVKAVIVAPTESEPGDLVVLDGSRSSKAQQYRWLLVNSNKSFLPVDDGTKAVFASGQAGDYKFVLVVAGVDANDRLDVSIATHTITIRGPPPVAEKPAKPDAPGDEAVIVFESSRGAVPLHADAAARELRGQGKTIRIVDKDAVTGTGGTPAHLKPFLEAATRLPALVVARGGKYTSTPLPATVEGIKAAVK